MTIRLIEAGSRLLELRDGVANVYFHAYSLPPYFEVPNDIVLLKQNWPKLLEKPKFRLVVAEDHGDVVGFAYGWRTSPGDHLREILMERLPAEDGPLWTSDSFELGDFAILPEHQGRGIGREIYTMFFSGLPERRAILKTHADDSAATRMYERRGFTRLLPPFIWGPKHLPYTVMGLIRAAQQ